jgi:hypothetical protein
MVDTGRLKSFSKKYQYSSKNAVSKKYQYSSKNAVSKKYQYSSKNAVSKKYQYSSKNEVSKAYQYSKNELSKTYQYKARTRFCLDLKYKDHIAVPLGVDHALEVHVLDLRQGCHERGRLGQVDQTVCRRHELTHFLEGCT